MKEQLANHLKKIKALKSRDYWQKYCACEDWYEKDFQYVVKHVINQNATFRRKQWECATIFLNLMNYGMLEGDKVGAAFGAGREKLLFRISPLTAKFYATDVYSMYTVWSTANIDKFSNPEEFVKAKTPPNTDTSNMEVHDMDMRDLSFFADNSLDFCYSSCAFEHIGDRDDFISHLKEVRRVLKPNGIYSMTTEFLFNGETKPLKGNYKFDLEYLRELFLEAGLDTPEDFDGRCEPNLVNWPKPPMDSISAKSLTNQIPTPILYLEGIPYSTCNFVLSPSESDTPKTFKERGMDHAANMFTNRSIENIKRAFKSWQLLDPYNRLRREVKNYMEDHRDYLVESGFELNIEENLVNGLLVYTDFIHLDKFPGTYKVQYDLEGYDGKVSWQVVEKDPMRVEGRQTIINQVETDHVNRGFTIAFQPKSNKVYAMSAKIEPNKNNARVKIKNLLVWLKAAID